VLSANTRVAGIADQQNATASTNCVKSNIFVRKEELCGYRQHILFIHPVDAVAFGPALLLVIDEADPRNRVRKLGNVVLRARTISDVSKKSRLGSLDQERVAVAVVKWKVPAKKLFIGTAFFARAESRFFLRKQLIQLGHKFRHFRNACCGVVGPRNRYSLKAHQQRGCRGKPHHSFPHSAIHSGASPMIGPFRPWI